MSHCGAYDKLQRNVCRLWSFSERATEDSLTSHVSSGAKQPCLSVYLLIDMHVYMYIYTNNYNKRGHKFERKLSGIHMRFSREEREE